MKKKTARSLAVLTAAAMTATTFFGTGIPAVQAADEWIGDSQLSDSGTAAPDPDEVLPSKNQYRYQKDELAATSDRIRSMRSSGARTTGTKSPMRSSNWKKTLTQIIT